MQLLLAVLAPGSLNHIANIVKGYAIAIGVAFAIYMVWRWWQTREREAAVERTARARGVWARQLALALAYPELAAPGETGPAERMRYGSYVASLLAASDEILALDDKAEWRATLARHLAPHRAFLASSEFRDTLLKDCTEATRDVVRAATAG
jgi:hypothetical protein